MMGVRGIDRSLEQWQMEVKDLRRRMILASTPRERERWYALWLIAQGGRPQPRRRLWKGIPNRTLASHETPAGDTPQKLHPVEHPSLALYGTHDADRHGTGGIGLNLSGPVVSKFDR